MRIVFFGNGPRGVRCLEALRENGYEIACVVGHKPEADVVRVAQARQLPVDHPLKVNATDFVARMHALTPDLFILAGYNQILHTRIIQVPKTGVLNLHGGKLPEYRGVAPINWQIIRGETTGGCCVIFVDEGIDTGDIVEQAYYDIDGNDTAGDLVQKQLELFPPMLLRAVHGIKTGTVTRQKQDTSAGAYFTRRYPKDSRLDFTRRSAQEAHNLIRAMNGPGYPPAYAYYKNQKCELRVSRLLTEAIHGEPGRIALKSKEGAVVIAKDRALLITEIALDGHAPTNPRRVLEMGEDFT